MPPKKRGRPRKTSVPPAKRADRHNGGPGTSKAVVPYGAGPSTNPPPPREDPSKFRPTSAAELAPHIRAALLQYWPEEAVDRMLKETIPQRKVLFDLMVQCPPPPSASAPNSQEASSSRPRAEPHCKCCPNHPNNRALRKKECYTCGKEGPRFRMAKCGRCRAWFHPECEGCDPKTEDDDPAFDDWLCEDCQAAIDAEANTVEISDDEDDATGEPTESTSEESEEDDKPSPEDDFDSTDFSD